MDLLPSTLSSNFDVDQLILKVSFNNNLSLFIMVSYIPPGSSLELYNLHLCNYRHFLSNLNSSDCVICLGDFNIGDVNWKLDADDKYLVPFNVTTEIEASVIDLFSQFDLVQINCFYNSLNRILDFVFVDKELIADIDMLDYPIVKNSIHHICLAIDIELLNYFKYSVNFSERSFDFKRANFDAMNSSLFSLP